MIERVKISGMLTASDMTNVIDTKMRIKAFWPLRHLSVIQSSYDYLSIEDCKKVVQDNREIISLSAKNLRDYQRLAKVRLEKMMAKAQLESKAF